MSATIEMTWQDVEVAIGRLLAQFGEASYEPKHIVGVTKGGIIPAALIHQAFPAATFGTVHVKSYAHDIVPKDPEFVETPHYHPNHPETLFVDDILDTGGTNKFLRKKWPNATFAFMSVRDRNVHDAQYHGWIWGRGWIIFPWEAVEEVKIPF